MKKTFFWGFLLLSTALLLSAQAEQKTDENQGERNGKVLTRTYELRHVSARSIRSIISPYILQMGQSDASSCVVVTLYEKNVKPFEELLARLDQPKKNIRFRIFTVIASNRAAARPSELHPDLEGVVDELKKVLGYKTYRLDGVSSLMAADGSEQNELDLNSQIDDLQFILYNVTLSRSEDDNKMMIKAGLVLREQFGGIIVEKDRKVINRQLIRVDSMQLREDGYLVAGVSRLGKDGDALVLVINATVQ